MHHRHGGVLPVRPISNVSKHLYDVLSGLVCTPPTIPRRLNWLLTWTTISSPTFLTILAVFCTNFSRTTLMIAYPVASTRVQLWRRGCGRHQEAAARNKRVPYSLDDNVGRIASPCEVCAKPAELGLNENSCEQNDNFR